MRKSLIIILLLTAVLLTACTGASPDPSPAPVQTAAPTAAPVETPEPTATPAPTEQVMEGPYYIKVNNECNTVTVYSMGGNGELTPCKAMVCSTGTATPESGVFELTWQGKWEWLALFGDVFGQYCTQIDGNILFHSVPYMREGDKSSLEYWQFDQLGTACSMGCIRLQVVDAKWIFDNREDITAVEFYSDEDPGPLGKPVPPNIGSNVELRGWDPTDPDPENPWNK